MFGYLDFMFLSYSGRIGRTAYWLSFVVLTIVEVAAFALLLRLSHGSLEQLVQFRHNPDAIPDSVMQDMFVHVMLPPMIVMALFLYPSYAITTKRWHDRDKSGWWSLIMFVPLIGGIWAFVELGLLGGSDGANGYGVRD
jgi:uncharacterized membrane protein YhaH (DUF805 family)